LKLERKANNVAASAELLLGEQAKFFPSDAALSSWIAQADQGKAEIVYEI
jgi:DNA polymerase-3 subunit alpha